MRRGNDAKQVKLVIQKRWRGLLEPMLFVSTKGKESGRVKSKVRGCKLEDPSVPAPGIVIFFVLGTIRVRVGSADEHGTEPACGSAAV